MIPPYLLHPLSANGASFYGGIGGDLGYLTLVVALVGHAVMTYRQHECHIDGCHWPAWHIHPDHGHPVCRKHHPHTITA